MNFALKVIVLVLAGMVLVFLGVGWLLPAQWRVDTTQAVAAVPERVVALLGDLSTWKSWSTFQATLGPKTDVRLEGTGGQGGQRMVWTGAQGEAVLSLLRVDGGGVDYEFTMRMAGDTVATRQGSGTIGVTPKDGGCEVHWHDEHTLDSLALRWFAWFGAVQEAVRRIQQTSLEGLRQQLEGAK